MAVLVAACSFDYREAAKNPAYQVFRYNDAHGAILYGFADPQRIEQVFLAIPPWILPGLFLQTSAVLHYAGLHSSIHLT